MTKQDKKELLRKALTYHEDNHLDKADNIYIAILEDDPEDFDANHLHGLVLSQNKMFAQSIKFYEKAHEINNNNIELLNNYAISLRNTFVYSKCESLLKSAIIKNPKFLNSYINLSNCFISQKKLDDALDVINKANAIFSNPEIIMRKKLSIYIELYNSERKKIYLDKAIIILDTLNLEEINDSSIIDNYGLVYLWAKKLKKANELFKISEKKSQQPPSISDLQKLKDKSILKNLVEHEYQQISHIDSDSDGIRNMKITQKFFDNLHQIHNKEHKQYDFDDLSFISTLHSIKYNKPPKLQNEYLNTSINIQKYEDEYITSDPEIVVIDNFLTNEFLNELQIFFRCANIFKRPYPRGYIGAFLGTGMSNEAVLEFSEELRTKFKNIFLKYHLSQAWAFKYDTEKKGINIHADDAKVNVNFWITPELANLNKNSGGLIIWKKQPHLDASFHDFNSLESAEKIYDEVKDVDSIKIPYKENRAIIFNSKLYHATDSIEFKDDYVNRRVNVTFLYS
tara:strand:- start:3792 stop:5324 length:1533 start_codon:yes stop_codon:yes gene_type:complete